VIIEFTINDERDFVDLLHDVAICQAPYIFTVFMCIKAQFNNQLAFNNGKYYIFISNKDPNFIGSTMRYLSQGY